MFFNFCFPDQGVDQTKRDEENFHWELTGSLYIFLAWKYTSKKRFTVQLQRSQELKERNGFWKFYNLPVYTYLPVPLNMLEI